MINTYIREKKMCLKIGLTFSEFRVTGGPKSRLMGEENEKRKKSKRKAVC